MKSPINAVLAITITAFAWHAYTSEQVEHKPTTKDGSMSARSSCYEESTGKLVGSQRSRTSVLVSPDELYRAYAESEAVASQASNATPECKNTSKLFVAGPDNQGFRPVLVVQPLREALGNSIDLVDWSPSGHRLLLAQGNWQWASDAGGVSARIYDAESRNLSSESLIDEAFIKHLGKKCAAVIYPIGFSSSGEVVVRAGPYFDVGEDTPVKDSCVQQEGLWLLGVAAPAVTQLPPNYKVEHYAKVSP